TRLPPDFLMELPANLGRLAYRYYYRETNEMMVQALERRSHWYRFAGFGFSATLVLLYALALLTGCGSYVPSQGGQSQTTPTSIPAVMPSPTLAQQVQNCGKVDTTLNGKPVDANQARLVGNCFWQAFQNCQAASLILKEHSLDT